MALLVVESSKEPADLYFASDRQPVLKELDSFLPRDPAGIVASYVVGSDDVFGAAHWKKYFDVDVIDPPKLPPAFYDWWLSFDSSATKPCETHLPPVLCPAGLTVQKLAQLIEQPKEGYKTKLLNPPQAILESVAGPTCWIVMRKEVLGHWRVARQIMQQLIKVNNEEFGHKYEDRVSAIDLITVLFARYVSTGERYLTDTHSFIIKEYRKHTKDYALIVGGWGPFGLKVLCNNGDGQDKVGIANLRKF